MATPISAMRSAALSDAYAALSGEQPDRVRLRATIVDPVWAARWSRVLAVWPAPVLPGEALEQSDDDVITMTALAALWRAYAPSATIRRAGERAGIARLIAERALPHEVAQTWRAALVGDAAHTPAIALADHLAAVRRGGADVPTAFAQWIAALHMSTRDFVAILHGIGPAVAHARALLTAADGRVATAQPLRR